MEEPPGHQGESQSQVTGFEETNHGPGVAQAPRDSAEVPVFPTEAPITPAETQISHAKAPISPAETPISPAPIATIENPISPAEASKAHAENPISPPKAPIAPAESFQVDQALPSPITLSSQTPSPTNTQDPAPSSSSAQTLTAESKPDVIPPPVASLSSVQSLPKNPGDTTTSKDSNIKPTDTQGSSVPKPTALPSKIPTPAGSKAPQPSYQAPSSEIPPANQPSLTPQQTRALQQQSESPNTARTKVSTQIQMGPPANVSTQAEQPKSKTPEPPVPSKEPPKSEGLPKPTLTAEAPQAPKETLKPTLTQGKSPEDPATPSTPAQKAPPSPTTSAGGSNTATPSPRELTLYFSYGSYYSQKVLLALYEKDLTFTPHVIKLDNNEQLEPWFISINPKAEVPVLKAGDKYVTESEVIINYIGRLPISAGNTLVGDSRSASGQTIQRFRRLLDGVNIPLLTYGLVHHPHLSKGAIRIPSFRQQLMKERTSTKLSVLAGLADTYPEHRASYLSLSETHAQKYETLTDEGAVKRELDQLATILRKVEEQLTKSQGPQDPTTSGSWLCGAEFTAADITLLALLTRLHLLGLDADYLQDDLPLVQGYYKRAVDRPSYQRLLKDSPGASSAVFPFLLYNSKKALPYVGGVTAVGVVAGVAYWLYKKVT